MGYVKLRYMLEQSACTVRPYYFAVCLDSSPKSFFQNNPHLYLFPFALTIRYLLLILLWDNLEVRINQQETNFKFLNYVQTLLSLIVCAFPNNMFSKEILLGPSETTREELFFHPSKNIQNFSFTDYIAKMPEHKKEIDISFLEWFIGFSEGDGSFLISQNRPLFVINQADIEVLYKIRTTLGFGVVSSFNQKGCTYARYTVKNIESIERLIFIFNGNLQLEKVQTRFNRWVQSYNFYRSKNIVVKPSRKATQITLESAWISGFFDAEGGFYSNVATKKAKYERLYIKTYVDQQYELETLKQIAKLFKVASVTVRNEEKEYYRVDISSKLSLEIAMLYFNTYKLKTRKNKAYAIWVKILNLYLKNEHLSRMTVIKRATERIKEMNIEFKRVKSVFKISVPLQKL